MNTFPAPSVHGPLFVKLGVYNCCGGPQLETRKVDNLAAAAKTVREYIDLEDIGNRDWCGGEVFSADGTCVAVVSYNGRVWEPGAQNPEGQYVPGPREFGLERIDQAGT